MFRRQIKVEPEIVAAITAAIGLMMDEGSRFEIRDIRPVPAIPGVSLWGKVGLMDLMHGRVRVAARERR